MVVRNYACPSRVVTWYVGHEQEVNPVLEDLYRLVEKQGKRSSSAMA
jgi:hypothetical protein